MTTAATITEAERATLLDHYRAVRACTDALSAPLAPEDQQVQSMPDVSPTKWHRAHVTWFFETFVLVPECAGYTRLDDRYNYLFNSYYEAVGARHARPERGLITRPSCTQIAEYRSHVDAAMTDFLAHGDAATVSRLAPLVELGLHHEQQHQELLLMDIKHVLSRCTFDPAYSAACDGEDADAPTTRLMWARFDGGLVDIGHDPASGAFAFDNEAPAHTVLLPSFEIADRLVTAGEWIEFIADGGYDRVELWLSDGWGARQREGWDAPLYWERDGAGWSVLTLGGRRRVRTSEPVVHVSHYEADAYARRRGARLPTEFEWEHVARSTPPERAPDVMTPEGALHPRPADAAASGIRQLVGDVWEWTSSAYLPYPRFRPAAGAVGEYNGKFMANQMVLRGGACVTPAGHVRPSYRNFFYPYQRWMFSGVRLARDVER